MKTGKLSNSIMRRSVYGILKKNRIDGNKAPQIGDETIATVVDGKLIQIVESGKYAVYRAVARCVAAGAKPVAISIQAIVPKRFVEHDIKEMIREIKGHSDNVGVAINNVNVLVEPTLKQPVVTACCAAVADKNVKSYADVTSNSDIVMTGFIGAEGVKIIAQANKDRICEYFTESFYESALGEVSELDVSDASRVAYENGAEAVGAVGEGGIFAALWNMSECSGVGLDVDFKKIPVKQEIIEVCELLEKNPYELSSFGSLLITTKDGNQLVSRLNEAGVRACVIGRTTDSNDKIIRNDDEVRFLDTPKQDEIYGE